MNPNTIRIIDKWAGQPICFFLTMLKTVSPSFGKKPVDSILFIKLIEQGATVLAYSAIKKAVDLVGRENVYFCVFEENRPVLDILDMIPKENVIVIRQSNLVIFLLDILGLLIQDRLITTNLM